MTESSDPPPDETRAAPASALAAYVSNPAATPSVAAVSPTATSPFAATTTTGHTARRIGDTIASIVLMVLTPGAVILSMIVSSFATVGSTACAPGACDWFGWWVSGGLIAAPLIAIVGAAITIFRIAKRKLAWPWMAAAIALSLLVGIVVLAMSFAVYQ